METKTTFRTFNSSETPSRHIEPPTQPPGLPKTQKNSEEIIKWFTMTD